MATGNTTNRTLNLPEISGADKAYCAVMAPILFVSSSCLGILNLPVTYCHAKRKRSLERALFVTLAIADLITTYPLGCMEAIQLFRVFSNQTLIEGTINLIFVTSVSLIGCLSQSIATFLSVIRTIRIKNPFVRCNGRIVIACIFLTNMIFAISQAVTFRYFIVKPKTADLAWLNNHIFISTNVAFYVTFVLALIGNISSFFGVVYLHVHNRTRRRSVAEYDNSAAAVIDQRIETTLLLMNIPYIIQLISSLAYLKHLMSFKPIFDYRRELHYLSAPILTSCYNPVILLLRNAVYRQQTFQLLRKICCCRHTPNPESHISSH